MEKVGDERLVRETERLFEHLEEEENKKKRAKVGEESGESKPSTSSSGPATAQEIVSRSRGGVPMAKDSGDVVPETVKRKAEDGEREVAEEAKEKKNKTGKEEERRAKRSVEDWEEFARKD